MAKRRHYKAHYKKSRKGVGGIKKSLFKALGIPDTEYSEKAATEILHIPAFLPGDILSVDDDDDPESLQFGTIGYNVTYNITKPNGVVLTGISVPGTEKESKPVEIEVPIVTDNKSRKVRL